MRGDSLRMRNLVCDQYPLNFGLDGESMSLKQKIVTKFVCVTHEWNSLVHKAVDDRIYRAYHDMYTEEARNSMSHEEIDERIKGMRDFYYARMSTTASLLLAVVSTIIAVIALIVAVLPIFIGQN